MDDYELWSEDPKNKSEEDIYYEDLTEQGFKVNELMARLLEDGKLYEDIIIQIGASTAFMWIGKYKDYDTDFIPFAKNEYEKAKKSVERLQNAVQEHIKNIPTFDKKNSRKINYLAEVSSRFKRFGERLGELEYELRGAVKTHRYGPYDTRKVLEVYKSIQPDKDAILIKIVGEEHGKYWDLDEVGTNIPDEEETDEDNT